VGGRSRAWASRRTPGQRHPERPGSLCSAGILELEAPARPQVQTGVTGYNEGVDLAHGHVARALFVSLCRHPRRVPGVDQRVLRPAGKASSLGGADRKAKGEHTMGDKSPKSVHKQATQKQTKAVTEKQKKDAAQAARQAASAPPAPKAISKK
jgi:hypothetical protein